MNFEEITPTEFTKFAEKSPYKSFMQTTEIAKLRENSGWTPYYFAVRDIKTKKLKAATMAVAKPTFLGKSVFYAPGGPLMDYADEELVNFFIKHLKSYLKTHNAYVLQIDPYYTLKTRDVNGNPTGNAKNHKDPVKTLQNLGFFTFKSSQPKYLFALPLKNQIPDDLMKTFKQNTRNLIRRCDKLGVKVRELTRDELPIFKKITTSTSERRHFSDRPLSYYQQMYDLFAKKGQVKFLVAEINREDLSEPESNASEKRQLPEKTFSRSIFGNEVKEFAGSRALRSAAARELAPAARGDGPAGRGPGSGKFLTTTPIAAAMFVLYGDEVIYLFSGSEKQYMHKYNAQYAIQWTMIKYALDHGYDRYNFYGIQSLPNPTSKDYGIYQFKKGFAPENGQILELLGSYELPISPLFYHLHRILSRFKSVI